MDPVTILSFIAMGQKLIETAVKLADTLKRQGQLTDADLERIKTEARISDSRWDALVTQARDLQPKPL